jgi:hypothetical protein
LGSRHFDNFDDGLGKGITRTFRSDDWVAYSKSFKAGFLWEEVGKADLAQR